MVLEDKIPKSVSLALITGSAGPGSSRLQGEPVLWPLQNLVAAISSWLLATSLYPMPLWVHGFLFCGLWICLCLFCRRSWIAAFGAHIVRIQDNPGSAPHLMILTLVISPNTIFSKTVMFLIPGMKSDINQGFYHCAMACLWISSW